MIALLTSVLRHFCSKLLLLSITAACSVSVFLREGQAIDGELRKRRVKIKLQERPLQILQMLLQHPGEVVTRDELQQLMCYASPALTGRI